MHPFAHAQEQRCSFEHIYFSNPASTVFRKSVIQFRKRLGYALEQVAPAEADVVVPIPDSANFIAIGYGESRRSGTYAQLIMRNHDTARSFIAATQAKRDEEVARKFLFAADEIKGKRVVLVDDSIVRGTTLPKIVRHMRAVGAASIHVRIGSPEIIHPCFYGMDFPDEDKLVAAHHTAPQIARMVGADSLEYLPLSVLKTMYVDPQNYCFACMNGQRW